MKKFLSLLLCVALLTCTMSGCAKDLNLKDKTVIPYGLFNTDEKDPCIKYKVCVPNVVWGCVLCETFFVPVLIFGWFLYEPIGQKDCGQPTTK
jgi:hypothetical protein